MTTQICTTVEQSERLLGAGLKPETSPDCLNLETYTKMWDLATLLGMMPRFIDKYTLSLNRFELGWYVAYKTGLEGTVPEILHEECYDGTLFGVVIRMIEWLIKNGHFDKKWLVKKGDKE